MRPSVQRQFTVRAGAAATDILSGVAAGLAAAFVMNLFQSGLSEVLALDQPEETAATKAADELSEAVSGNPVKRPLKKKADGVMHYLTGAFAGGAYGLLRARAPVPGAARGLLYGGSLWLVADEALVPALGLTPPPSWRDFPAQALGLASHLVFGLTLDLVQRHIKRRIAPNPGRLSAD